MLYLIESLHPGTTSFHRRKAVAPLKAELPARLNLCIQVAHSFHRRKAVAPLKGSTHTDVVGDDLVVSIAERRWPY